MIVNKPDNHTKAAEGGIADLWDEIRRAFAEFLTIPTAVIVVFLLLAAGSYIVESADTVWFQAAREVLKRHVFADSKATNELLGTIAGGIITVTSIIISLLLVALQQSAASLTHQVFDQFLRRRINQFYFGFFVGLSLFSLVTVATVTESFNPVFGASLAFLFTMAGLYLPILLLYTTINQMRPAVIIEAIHGHTLAARHCLLPLVDGCLRDSGGCLIRIHAAPELCRSYAHLRSDVRPPAAGTAAARRGYHPAYSLGAWRVRSHG